MIPYEQIIGIFDLDNASDAKWTREFLRNAEQQSVVISVCDDLPRSFVVADHPYHDQIVYLSQLSAQTLQKRVETGPLSE